MRDVWPERPRGEVDLWKEFLESRDLQPPRVDIMGKVLHDVTETIVQPDKREKLVQKIKEGKLLMGDAQKKAMLSASMDLLQALFEVAPVELIELVPHSLSIFPPLIGKELFIRVRDVGIFRARVGMLPKIIELTPTTIEEIKADPIPGIELDLDIIPLLFQGYGGLAAVVSEGLLKIYGVEVLSTWFSDTMGLMVSLMALTRKEIMDSIEEPFISAKSPAHCFISLRRSIHAGMIMVEYADTPSSEGHRFRPRVIEINEVDKGRPR